jgi:hypothetical protein
MEPLKPAPFFSARNVPFWAGVLLLAIVLGLVVWMS